MTYNSKIHHRRSIRLKGYDYAKAGLYFITICCQNRLCRFGEIHQDEMELNEYGQIAYNEWVKLPERFPNFELDVFQIMPNHMHGIVALNDGVAVGASLADAQPTDAQPTDAQPTDAQPTDAQPTDAQNDCDAKTGQPQGFAPTKNHTVGDIIGAYKSLVANDCLRIYKIKNQIMGKLWHRNYYEHIIRDEQSYQRISEYIINNPAKWNEDKFYRAK